MLALCRKALPGWEQLSEADVKFSTVTGGISNINAKLSPKEGLGLAPVMFKVFGDNTDQIIDREAETVVVVALGQQGFGPKVLALLANGRIEEWLNCVCLSPEDMCKPQLVPRIARQLRRFHGLDINLPKQPHTPWGVIRDWLAQAKKLTFTDAAKQAAYESIDFAVLESEVSEAEAVCALTGSPLVFGHNDLLSGNILVLQQPGFDPASPDMSGRVVFIDYEYGAYTSRDFDIGNHFTEYAGFEGDYTRYPSKQQQELFFRYYMAEDVLMQAAAANHPPQQEQHQQQHVDRLGSSDIGSAAEPPPLPAELLDRLSASANVWALASHLYWGIWAIIQACYSPIDFDYIQFHHTRLGEFRRRKAEFLAEALRVFGGSIGNSSSNAGAGAAAAALDQERLQEAEPVLVAR